MISGDISTDPIGTAFPVLRPGLDHDPALSKAGFYFLSHRRARRWSSSQFRRHSTGQFELHSARQCGKNRRDLLFLSIGVQFSAEDRRDLLFLSICVQFSAEDRRDLLFTFVGIEFCDRRRWFQFGGRFRFVSIGMRSDQRQRSIADFAF